jgi:hypothetical protein
MKFANATIVSKLCTTYHDLSIFSNAASSFKLTDIGMLKKFVNAKQLLQDISYIY